VTSVFNRPAVSILSVEVIGAGLWVGYLARVKEVEQKKKLASESQRQERGIRTLSWTVDKRAGKILFIVTAGGS
jgi:hypothetical protein